MLQFTVIITLNFNALPAAAVPQGRAFPILDKFIKGKETGIVQIPLYLL